MIRKASFAWYGKAMKNIQCSLSYRGLVIHIRFFLSFLLLIAALSQSQSLLTMSATTTITQTQPPPRHPEPVTADNVLRLFPEVRSSYPPSHQVHSQSSPTIDNDLAGYDEEQIKLMDEVCIVLDTYDNPIGSASKKTCPSPPSPHSSFSIFFATTIPSLSFT